MNGRALSVDVTSLLDRVPLAGRPKADLLDRMSESHRRYHGLDHLATLWRRHRRHASAAAFDVALHEEKIACAIAFHDCVYLGGRRDNEARSAEVWLAAARDSAMDEADRLWVAETIHATADHIAYSERPGDKNAEQARLWMLDLDLTPLGESREAFDRNTLLLREEVPHLSAEDYDRGRLHFLQRVAAAPRIYRTSALAAIYEERARANIARQRPGPSALP